LRLHPLVHRFDARRARLHLLNDLRQLATHLLHACMPRRTSSENIHAITPAATAD
jgi:hypothetical protein